MLRAIARLYFIHLFAWLAVWMAMSISGLDIVLSLLYVYIVVKENTLLRGYSAGKRLAGLIFWQGPAAFLSLVSISSWALGGLKEYAFFMLEFWYTPLLPLLSLSGGMLNGRPYYYYLLLGMPLIMSIIYFRASKRPVHAPVES